MPLQRTIKILFYGNPTLVRFSCHIEFFVLQFSIDLCMLDYSKLFSITFFITLGGVIYKLVTNKHRILILWGNTAAGKTALLSRLNGEDVSEIYAHTQSMTKRNPDSFCVGKITIHPLVIDSPGDDLTSAMNSVSFFQRKRIIFVYVLAPVGDVSKGDTKNYEYIKEQLQQMKNVLSIHIKNKFLKKVRPKKVILYLNKADLIGNNEKEVQQLFARHISEAKSICGTIPLEIFIGSALKDADGKIKKFKNIIPNN